MQLINVAYGLPGNGVDSAAWAAVIIAALAFVLTYVQWRRATRVTMAQLRPYVLVELMKINHLSVEENKVQIIVTYKNTGQTPAVDFEAYALLRPMPPEAYGQGAELLVPSNLSKSPLGPGQAQSQIIGNDTFDLTAELFAELEAQRQILYVAATLRYTDAFNISHETQVRAFVPKEAYTDAFAHPAGCSVGNTMT